MKRKLFFIVLAVIVVAGLAAWALTVPKINEQAAEYLTKCNDKLKNFKELADKASQPDGIVTDAHLKQAGEFKKKAEEQLAAVKKEVQNLKLDLRFDDADKESTKFDIWLAELRKKITQQATQAGLQLPADADKLMFSSPTNDNDPNLEKHRDFRLRQMALVQEVVDVLCKTRIKQQVARFQQDPNVAEAQESADMGALALEKLAILPSKNMLPAQERAGRDASMVSADERARNWVEEALRRGGRTVQTGLARSAVRATYQELPYGITGVDIYFIAPLAAVPAIVQALESSNRYTAVVSRIDFQRAITPYPAPNEPKLAKAGPVPGFNTHYQEGPVRAVVSMDLYEYDKIKEEQPKALPPPEKKDKPK